MLGLEQFELPPDTMKPVKTPGLKTSKRELDEAEEYEEKQERKEEAEQEEQKESKTTKPIKLNEPNVSVKYTTGTGKTNIIKNQLEIRKILKKFVDMPAKFAQNSNMKLPHLSYYPGYRQVLIDGLNMGEFNPTTYGVTPYDKIDPLQGVFPALEDKLMIKYINSHRDLTNKDKKNILYWYAQNRNRIRRDVAQNFMLEYTEYINEPNIQSQIKFSPEYRFGRMAVHVQNEIDKVFNESNEKRKRKRKRKQPNEGYSAPPKEPSESPSDQGGPTGKPNTGTEPMIIAKSAPPPTQEEYQQQQQQQSQQGKQQSQQEPMNISKTPGPQQTMEVEEPEEDEEGDIEIKEVEEPEEQSNIQEVTEEEATGYKPRVQTPPLITDDQKEEVINQIDDMAERQQKLATETVDPMHPIESLIEMLPKEEKDARLPENKQEAMESIEPLKKLELKNPQEADKLITEEIRKNKLEKKDKEGHVINETEPYVKLWSQIVLDPRFKSDLYTSYFYNVSAIVHASFQQNELPKDFFGDSIYLNNLYAGYSSGLIKTPNQSIAIHEPFFNRNPQLLKSQLWHQKNTQPLLTEVDIGVVNSWKKEELYDVLAKFSFSKDNTNYPAQDRYYIFKLLDYYLRSSTISDYNKYIETLVKIDNDMNHEYHQYKFVREGKKLTPIKALQEITKQLPQLQQIYKNYSPGINDFHQWYKNTLKTFGWMASSLDYDKRWILQQANKGISLIFRDDLKRTRTQWKDSWLILWAKLFEDPKLANELTTNNILKEELQKEDLVNKANEYMSNMGNPDLPTRSNFNQALNRMLVNVSQKSEKFIDQERPMNSVELSNLYKLVWYTKNPNELKAKDKELRDLLMKYEEQQTKKGRGKLDLFRG